MKRDHSKSSKRFIRLCDPDGYGNGTWWRRVGKKAYHVIRIIDMHDATGDHSGNKYDVDLVLLDINEVPEKEIASARDYVGMEKEEQNEAMLVDACHSYGIRAPLHDVSTNNRGKGFRECRKESYSLAADAAKMEERLNRSVNGIGSTAREYMQGDHLSAMARGVAAGKPEAKLMAKLHGLEGVEPEIVTHTFHVKTHDPDFLRVSGSDPIPYAMGVVHGLLNRRRDDGDVVQAYIDGFKEGIAIRRGDSPMPSWLIPRKGPVACQA